jgi:two-component system chemotaxis response regulator CheB
MKAVAMLREWQPDVVTMDIQMPNKDGVELVREIMASDRPLPIVMVSSLSLDEGSLVFEALNAGAFHYIQKPKLEDREAFDEQLHDCILEAAVGRRMPKTIVPAPKRMASTHYPKDLIWCLGSSTGGTQALTQIFTSLPDRIPPTLIVQHIPPVFSAAFANSLNNLCPFTVKEAQEGDIVKENHVYIAPGGKHMALVCRCSGGPITISLQDTEPVNRFKPSVDYMFAQVKALQGWRVVAGLLTGMGRDGAEGLLGLRQAGARTFAQDEDTSAVYGMPRAAAEIGAAEEIVALEDVGQTLMNLSPAAGFLKTG